MSPTDQATSISNDDLFLFHGMLLVAHPEGEISQSGLATLEGFFNTLPEFRGKDFDELLRQACKLQAKHGSLAESVKALEEIESSAVRVKLFVLAVDLAMSAGPLDSGREQLLEGLTEALQIDEETAVKVVAVLNLKYRQ